MSNTLRAYSSESSQASLNTSFDQPKVGEHLQAALSSSWSEYLRAQHTTREVSNLKQHVEDQVKQIYDSVKSLQQHNTNLERFVTATAAQCKLRCDEFTSHLDLLKSLRDDFPKLQQEAISNREQIVASTSDLGGKLTDLQKRVEGLGTLISTSTLAGQAPNDKFPEVIRALRDELKELRTATSKKISALEGQVKAMQASPPQPPQDEAEFLSVLLSRRDDLMKILENSAPASSTQLDTEIVFDETHAKSTPSPTSDYEPDLADASPRATTRKRKGGELEGSKKRLAPLKSQYLSNLLAQFRQRYKDDPPASDVTFIWRFLDSIQERGLSKHVQESLMTIIPEHVTFKPRFKKRYVRLADSLTWRDFQRALPQVPPQ
ncbi:hypothetical protein OQA88_10322 [Cercophora sp. LCS_1]